MPSCSRNVCELLLPSHVKTVDALVRVAFTPRIGNFYSIGAILIMYHAFGGYKGTSTVIDFDHIQWEGACRRMVASCS